MNAIVMTDKNWGIGKNGGLLTHIPEDMKFFKEKTIGNIVVMGRKTFESLPNHQPLHHRLNIIISANHEYKGDNVITLKSIDELLDYIYFHHRKDVYVMGGGSIYKELLKYCDSCYITKVDHEYDADTFFPNIDEMKNWKCESKSDDFIYDGLRYAFYTYKNQERILL